MLESQRTAIGSRGVDGIGSNDMHGFTLLEVLVAISIFSFIALGGFRLLSSTAQISDTGRLASENARAYKRASNVITSDFRNAINRSMPSSNQGAPDIAAFITHRDALVEFSRGAYGPSASEPRSDAIRVRYLLRDRNNTGRFNKKPSARYDLIRQISAMDGEQRGLEREQLLLSNVEFATIRFLDHKNTWHTEWPIRTEAGEQAGDESQAKTALDIEEIPRAVELDVRTSMASGPILIAIRA